MTPPSSPRSLPPEGTLAGSGRPGASAVHRLDLLNRWQHGFPLVERPFAQIAQALGATEDAVIAGFQAARADGSLSRIGGVWAAGDRKSVV